MKQFLKMKNPIQAYAWGSCSAIAELMGASAPTRDPQAELWMGAHPKAPSLVFWQDEWRPLNQLMQTYSREILGETGVERFGNEFPYLFKVLAAAAPLSIQAHPNKAQAEAGFVRENILKIPLGAAQRNYRDNNHKPECLCALTPFWALCGFRPAAEIEQQMRPFLTPDFEYLLTPLKTDDRHSGLKIFFQQIMTLDAGLRRSLLKQVVESAKERRKRSSEAEWVLTLDHHYPEDIGILSPLLLNLIRLAPGEAIFLNAGVLHAYLDGTGIELMANSDNVLRGGLTGKHMDVNEMMAVLAFADDPIQVLMPQESGPCHKKIITPAEEFELSIVTLEEGADYLSGRERGAEILLCTEGRTRLKDLAGGGGMDLFKGESVLVPADLDRYELTGCGVVFKARGPV